MMFAVAGAMIKTSANQPRDVRHIVFIRWNKHIVYTDFAKGSATLMGDNRRAFRHDDFYLRPALMSARINSAALKAAIPPLHENNFLFVSIFPILSSNYFYQLHAYS